MRALLLLAVLTAGPLRSEEPPAPSVREKLRARIVETLPPPSSGTLEDKPEQDGAVLVLEPMVVTESKGVRELEKALVEDRQRQKAEAFSLLKGGTLYRSERLELGIWGRPGSGWELLRLKW